MSKEAAARRARAFSRLGASIFSVFGIPIGIQGQVMRGLNARDAMLRRAPPADEQGAGDETQRGKVGRPGFNFSS